MVQKVCQNRIRDNKLRYSVSLHKNIKNLKLRDEKGRSPGKGCSPPSLLLLLLHLHLLGEHHLDKLLVVDVPLRVLLPMYQLLHLLLGHFLPEEEVEQLIHGKEDSQGNINYEEFVK